MAHLAMTDPFISSELKLALAEESFVASGNLVVRDLRAYARQPHIILLHMTIEPPSFWEAVSTWSLDQR
jgi:hypothetical protein